MMLRSDMILEELKEHFPALLPAFRIQVYKVPNGYFDKFAEQLLENIPYITVESVTLPAIQQPFSVPNGYFENLPQQILNKIKAHDKSLSVSEELEQIAPALLNISKKPVFSVPAHYFEKINFTAIAKGAEKNNNGNGTAKVISLRNTRKWFSYAAAAIIAGVLITGALWNNSSFTYSSNVFSLNKEITNVSDDAIQNYLNNDVTASNYINDTSIIDSDEALPDVQQGLQNISDEELSGYLKSTEENNNVPPAAETKKESGI
ncbi:hypothetical protein [Hydrotalea sp.]|uniref:hypothetical protein n=1 Tax=Hydrotalea sp. TaxID=2881279 RepID=UPI003D0DF2DE